jgi:hypothetical protein
VARKKPLPLPKGQKYGREYVADEMARRFASKIDEEGFVDLTYDPTRTTWPQNGWDHRRTTQAGYNKATKTLRIKFFTNGAEYDYHGVPQGVARQFRRAVSPGQFINQFLNSYSYERIN